MMCGAIRRLLAVTSAVSAFAASATESAPIVLIGDSMSVQWWVACMDWDRSGRPEPCTPYTLRVQDRIDARVTAVAGSTMVAWAVGWHPIGNVNGAVVHFMLGSNDAGMGVPPYLYGNAIHSLTDALYAAGAVSVWMTPSPRRYDGRVPMEVQEQIHDTALIACAERGNLTCASDPWEYLHEEHFPIDGVHPGDEASELLSRHLLRSLRRGSQLRQ